MKRFNRLLVLVACAFAACLVIAGCGGSDVDYSEPFVGTWEICEMTEDGEVTSQDDLDMLKAFGLTVYVDLNEDKTSSLELFGEAMSGTWEATAENTGKLIIDDYGADMTIEDGILVMTQDQDQLKFKKIDPADRVKTESVESAEDKLDEMLEEDIEGDIEEAEEAEEDEAA